MGVYLILDKPLRLSFDFSRIIAEGMNKTKNA
jgi:hypothetical protein